MQKKTFSSKRVRTPTFGFEDNALTICATIRVHDWFCFLCCQTTRRLMHSNASRFSANHTQTIDIFSLLGGIVVTPTPASPVTQKISYLCDHPSLPTWTQQVMPAKFQSDRCFLQKLQSDEYFSDFVGGLRPPNPPVWAVAVSETTSNAYSLLLIFVNFLIFYKYFIT